MKCTMLKQPLDTQGNPFNTHLQNQISDSSIYKKNTNKQNAKLKVLCLEDNYAPFFPYQKESHLPQPSLNEDHLKAKTYLSTIEDSLWKYVCQYVINMMGPASFLKIWDSTLGEICFQDQSMEIHCQTEETAQFIQQYDFVILGSLHPYFPSLKKLSIKTISTL